MGVEPSQGFTGESQSTQRSKPWMFPSLVVSYGWGLRTTGSVTNRLAEKATPVPLRKQGMDWILSLSFLAMSWTTEEPTQNHFKSMLDFISEAAQRLRACPRFLGLIYSYCLVEQTVAITDAFKIRFHRIIVISDIYIFCAHVCCWPTIWDNTKSELFFSGLFCRPMADLFFFGQFTFNNHPISFG